MTDIVITDITKKFTDKTVLCDFSACFPAGKTTCIMGKSGCGKTTLINIIMGFLTPDNGSIEGVPEKISAVFQEDRLYEDYSVLSNVSASAANGTQKEDIHSCLSELGLEDSVKKPVKSLSGGMKRRTAIARALLSDYDLLILDEPFSGLDKGTKNSVMAYVKKKTAEKTVVFITHSEQEAEFMGDKIIIMEESDNDD